MDRIMLEVSVFPKEGGGEIVSIIGYDIVSGVGLVQKSTIDESSREDVTDDLADWLAEEWPANEGV